MHYNNWNEGVGGLEAEFNMLNTQMRKNSLKNCKNCAILPRPLSRDHFCENLASLLFHSSAGERLQFNEVNLSLSIIKDLRSSFLIFTPKNSQFLKPQNLLQLLLISICFSREIEATI